jgi:release factor glutamine methyltransferase
VNQPKTVTQLLEIGERVLADSSHIFDDHDIATEAVELLASARGVEPEELENGEVVPPRQRDRYLSLIARRAAGEPFPVLVGQISFYGYDLRVRPGSFVPRPSSELTVQRALRRIRRRRRPRVADVCTGAAPIALAIAGEMPRAEVWGMDIDVRGLAQGRDNARRLGIDNLTLRKGDMYDALPRRLEGSFDLVTGHVPYVPFDELDELPSEVREHEPLFTLTDQSDDGLFLMRRAIFEAPEWLKPGGWLLLEVSEDLVSKLKRMYRKAGLENVRGVTDADRLSIVVEGRKPLRSPTSG